MYICDCLTINEYEKHNAYNYNEFDYTSLHTSYNTKKYSAFCTFDIETSRYKKCTDEYESFMYIAQICIDNNVIFCRKWNEVLYVFEEIINALGSNLVVYVHNLAYEFQFMKDFFTFTNVFSIDEHVVLKATTDTGLEFRCSYKLSNMNLQKFIENSPNHYFIKGVGDLDYSVLRTPKTELTEKELGYCYNDVRGLYNAIEQLLKDDDLESIPLTSTGYVRRECRKACRNKEDRKRFKESVVNLKVYNLLKKAFRGGNTASNRYHTNVILEDMGSYDISSSYPFVMMMYEYPYGKFNYASIESEEELSYYNNKYCTLGTYYFINIRLKDDYEPIPYLSFSKCTGVDKDALCYNGRVMNAKTLATTITNIDYEIIQGMYVWDEMYVDEFYFSKKKPLSKELRKVIMKYFTDKTKLKGIEEKYYFYTKQKNKLNSIFGMIVSSIIRDNYNYNVLENRIIKDEKTREEEEKEMEKYNKSYNSFLNYQWGVWVTAYARMRLQECIDKIGIDVVYCDTDSVKYLGDYTKEIEEINRITIKEIENMDIPCYVEHNNTRVYMGVWDKEKPYDKFITMGAKKYAYIQNGHIGVTVSGLNKTNAPTELEEKGGLKAFRRGTVFKNSGRVTVEYHHDKIHTIQIGDEEILTGSYINMFDTTYTLGISDTMLNIIDDSLLK